MAQVSLRKVVKRFDDTEAVRGIDLDIADKEFVVLVGPSGCGKSTTLRMIAGLEEISAGEIAVDGEVVNDVPPKDRDMAMVFQNYALYPHMTVYENMSFGLRLKRYPKDEIARRDFVFGVALEPQPERHVLVHGHVRKERVVLKHHGHIAILRRNVVDHLAVDRDLAGA